jgi:hypothetical protein
MDLLDIKDEFKNSKVLLVVLGTLLIPVIHSVDSLLVGLYKIFGLSFKSVSILSISFHGLIIVCLVIALYWTFSNQNSGQSKISLSHRTLKNWGIITFSILVAGAAVRVYTEIYSDKTPDISQIDSEGLTIHELAYISMTETGLMTLRHILLFIIYFVIVFRRKSD